MLVAVFSKTYLYIIYMYRNIFIYIFTLCVHYNVQCLHTIFGSVFLTQPDLLEKVPWAADSACCFALRVCLHATPCGLCGHWKVTAIQIS